MANTIDSLLSKLDQISTLADNVDIKLNKLALKNVKQGISGIGNTLYSSGSTGGYGLVTTATGPIISDAEKALNAISILVLDLAKIAKNTPINQINASNLIEIEKGLKSINSVITSIHGAAKLASKIDMILSSSGGMFKGGLEIDPKRIISSTRGSFYQKGTYNPGLIAFQPGSTSPTRTGQDILNTVYHEVAHLIDEQIRLFNLVPNIRESEKFSILDKYSETIYQPNFFKKYLKPLIDLQEKEYQNLANKYRAAGFDLENPEERDIVHRAAQYYSDPSEMFARNMASYFRTGKAEIPELQKYVEDIFNIIPKELKELVRKIYNSSTEIIKSATSGRGIASSSLSIFESNISKKGAAQQLKLFETAKPEFDITEYLQRKLEEIKSKKVGGGEQVSILQKVKPVTPDYLHNYYAALDEELQKRLVTYLTGKATGGTPSPERAREVAKQLISGEITGGRRRLGGGAKISLNPLMDEINKLINDTISESLKIKQKQFDEYLLTNKISEGFIFTDISQEEILKKVSIQTGPARKLKGTETTALRNLEVFSGKYLGFLDVVKSLGVDLSKLERLDISPMKVINDEFRKFILTVKDLEGPIQKITLYLGKANEILTEAEYKKAIGIATVPKTREELEAQLGAVRAGKLLQFAGQYGFSAENLKKLYTQQPTGVTIGQFEFIDENTKAISKLEITVDKYGNTLTRTNKRLLGFTDAVIRNTQEVLRWSVGVGLVYGTMYRLQNLIKIAIDNETKLADIAIILGDAQKDINIIFQEASKVANETGENINAVLETYALAYRAIGSVKDPVERTSVAIDLLTNSTILNKLSTLDAASSIDVLAGSLRQLQQPGETAAQAFSRGRDLLDKWVTITRKANVDLATLSTAFSITSESAENSGVSIEQLNAIIAALAEKIGGLGGRETGNAVRALIGGVYQQQAAEILTKYGIAVQNTAGQMRPFLDISKEIYDLYKEGVISSDELNKIGYVLGGGVRRGQQYVAFLSDFERIQGLVNEQLNASGAAQDALGRKIETTQTSLTKLGNAFQSLAQTLGTKGGVLDTFQGMISAFTLVVDLTDRLVASLGKVTVPTALLALLSMVFKGDTGRLRMQSLSSRFGGFAQGAAMSVMGAIPGGGFAQKVTTEKVVAGKLVEEIIPTQKAIKIGADIGYGFGKYAPGILISSMPGVFRALSGDFSGAGASIGGAIIGTLLTGGSPIGGLIGSTIAEVFIEQLRNNRADINEIVQNILKESAGETTGLEKTTGKGIRKQSIEEQLNLLVYEGLKDAYMKSPMIVTGPVSAMRAQQRIEELRSGEAFSEEYKQRILEFIRENVPAELDENLLKTSNIRAQILKQTEDEKKLIEEIIKLREKELKIKSATGEITPKENLEANKVLQGLDATLPKLYVIFGETFDKIDNTVQGTADVYSAFTDILINGTEEQRQSLIQAATEIEGYLALIENAKLTGQKLVELPTGETFTTEELEDKANKLREMYAEYLNLLRIEQELSKVKLPTIVGLDLKSLQDWEKVYAEAARLQQEYFDKAIEEGFMNETQSRMMIEKADKLFVKVGEIAGYRIAEGITDSRFLTEAVDKLKDELSSTSIGFQTFDVSYDILQKAVAQSFDVARQFEKYGYKPDYQEQITISKEGIVDPMKADWKIVQYLLQQILDTEKKQLDGIYNLPEGAGFYVPYQTLNLAYQKGLNEAAGMAAGGFSTLTYKNQPAQTPAEIAATQAEKEKLLQQRILANEERRNKLLEREKQTEGKYNKITSTYLPLITVPYKETKTFPQKDQDLIPPQIKTWWDDIKNFFEQFPGTGFDDAAYKNPPLRDLFEKMWEKSSTSLNLNLNSTTTLVVDGRVLAEIVKNYLYEDMIRYENTAGAINRTIAI